MLLPLRRMFERYETEKADSDVAAFYSLLYAGEHVIKLTVCGLLAGLQDDRDRHRYTPNACASARGWNWGMGNLLRCDAYRT